jgi:hypothetical protein
MGSEETDYGDFQAGGDPLGPDEAARYAIGQRRLAFGFAVGCAGLALAAVAAAVAGIVSVFR